MHRDINNVELPLEFSEALEIETFVVSRSMYSCVLYLYKSKYTFILFRPFSIFGTKRPTIHQIWIYRLQIVDSSTFRYRILINPFGTYGYALFETMMHLRFPNLSHVHSPVASSFTCTSVYTLHLLWSMGAPSCGKPLAAFLVSFAPVFVSFGYKF